MIEVCFRDEDWRFVTSLYSHDLEGSLAVAELHETPGKK